VFLCVTLPLRLWLLTICSHSTITKYQKRVPGPMLDRIDIHVEVPRVDYEKLSSDCLVDPSALIREWGEAAKGSRLFENFSA